MTDTTAATKKEEAAIRRWAKALRAAEKALDAARPDSVRPEVLEYLGINWLDPRCVVVKVLLARRAAEEAGKKSV